MYIFYINSLKDYSTVPFTNIVIDTFAKLVSKWTLKDYRVFFSYSIYTFVF